MIIENLSVRLEKLYLIFYLFFNLLVFNGCYLILIGNLVGKVVLDMRMWLIY